MEKHLHTQKLHQSKTLPIIKIPLLPLPKFQDPSTSCTLVRCSRGPAGIISLFQSNCYCFSRYFWNSIFCYIGDSIAILTTSFMNPLCCSHVPDWHSPPPSSAISTSSPSYWWTESSNRYLFPWPSMSTESDSS
jgi:hypothetical protein